MALRRAGDPLSSCSALTRAASVYWLGEVSSRGIQFLMLPLMASLLSASEYGLFAATGALLAGGATLLTVGLDSAVSRFVPPAGASQAVRLCESALGGVAVFASILAVPCVFLMSQIPGFGVLRAPEYLVACWAVLTLGPVGMLSLAVFRSREEPLRYVIVAVARVAVMAASFTAAWLLGVGGVSLALWPLLVSWVAFGVLGWLGLGACATPKISRRELMPLLVFGSSLLPHIAAHLVLGNTDRVLLQALAPGEEVGAYAFVYQLCLMVSLAAMAMNYSWSPRLMGFRRWDTASQANRLHTMRFVSVTSCVALLVCGCVPFFMDIMAGPQYQGGSDLVSTLCAAFLIQSVYICAVNPMLWLKRTKTISTVTIGAAFINVVMNIALIPVIGMWASASATLLCSAAIAIGLVVALGRKRKDCFELPRVSILVFAACLGLGSLQWLPIIARVVVGTILAGLFWLSVTKLGWAGTTEADVSERET